MAFPNTPTNGDDFTDLSSEKWVSQNDIWIKEASGSAVSYYSVEGYSSLPSTFSTYFIIDDTKDPQATYVWDQNDSEYVIYDTEEPIYPVVVLNNPSGVLTAQGATTSDSISKTWDAETKSVIIYAGIASDASLNTTITDVQVGGFSATKVAEMYDGAGEVYHAGVQIWVANVTGGMTQNVDLITSGDSGTYAALGSVVELDLEFNNFTPTAVIQTNMSQTPSGTIDVHKKGLVAAAFQARNLQTGTIDFFDAGEQQVHSAGTNNMDLYTATKGSIPADITGQSITADVGTVAELTNGTNLIVASWENSKFNQ